VGNGSNLEVCQVASSCVCTIPGLDKHCYCLAVFNPHQKLAPLSSSTIEKEADRQPLSLLHLPASDLRVIALVATAAAIAAALGFCLGWLCLGAFLTCF